jgi:hypothetical protein
MGRTGAWDDDARESWLAGLPCLGDPIGRFATKKPDKEWRSRFANMTGTSLQFPVSISAVADQEFRELYSRGITTLNEGLVAIGGWAAASERWDDDIGRILSRGRLMPADGAVRIGGFQR